MITKHILTLSGVKILTQIDSEDEIDKARLETVSSMIVNAFRSRDKSLIEEEDAQK